MAGLGLVLELRLDHIERAGRHPADDAGCCSGQGIDARTGEVAGGPY